MHATAADNNVVMRAKLVFMSVSWVGGEKT
jgi:hypothetical protein